MNTYTALNISDKYTPNTPEGLLSCIMSMLSSYSHYGVVHRRLSQQLRARTEDCWACWDATGIPLEFVVSISTIIMNNMGWPNNFYIPQDPVKLLLLSSFAQLDINATLIDLEESLGVDLFDDDGEETVIELRFEEFLRYIAARKELL